MEPRESVSDPASTAGSTRPSRQARQSRGWRVAAALVVSSVLVLGGAFLWARQALEGGTAADVAARLPADVSVVIMGRGILQQALEFRSLLHAVQPTDERARVELVRSSEDLLGFDATSARAWLGTGIDPTRPWAIAGRSEAGVGQEPTELILLLPSRDDAALRDTMLTLLARLAVSLEPAPGGGLVQLDGGALAFAVRDGYLVAVIARQSALASQRLEALQRSDNLLVDDAQFTNALRSQSDDWHTLAYAPGEALAPLRRRLSQGPSPSPLLHLGARGALATMRMTDERLIYRLTLSSAPDMSVDPTTPELVEPLDQRIPGNALAVLRLQIHPETAWANLQEQFGQQGMGRASSQLRGTTGIDFERDVVGNLDGRLTLALFPGRLSEEVPVNGVLYSGLRDPERFKTLLDLSFAKLPGFTNANVDRSADGTWYLTDALGLGVTHGNVIFAWGNPRELRAHIDRGGSSYVTALPGPVQKRLAGGQHVYGFLDAPRTVTFLAGHASARGLTDDVISAAKAVGGIDTSLGATASGWTIDGIVYAPEKGFSDALRPYATRLGSELQAAARDMVEKLKRRSGSKHP